VQAGGYGEALRRVTDRLCAEFTDPEAAELPGLGTTLAVDGGVNGVLDAEDEALVARLREALARIASTLGADADDPPVRAIATMLDGAEFVIRGELVKGNPEGVLSLLPSYVFLVALLVVGQDRAFELSRRTELLTKQFGV
jgi:hypothetical protein